MTQTLLGEGHLVLYGVLAGALAASLAFAAWLTFRDLLTRRGYRHPWKLFRELCRAHHLDRQSRRRLARLAAAHGLAQPSVLFIEPERFDVANLHASWKAERAELEFLRDTIFGRRLEELERSTG